MYSTTILLKCLGVKLGSLTLRVAFMWKVSENKVLKKIYVSKRGKVSDTQNCITWSSILQTIKSMRMRWIREEKCIKIFITNTWQAQAYIAGQHTMDLTGTLCNGVDWIQVAQEWIKPNSTLLWTQKWTTKFCWSTELFHHMSNYKFFTEPASLSYSVSQTVSQSVSQFSISCNECHYPQ